MAKEILRGLCDAIVEENCMWILTEHLNSLLRYDFKSKELDLIYFWGEKVGVEGGAFSKMVKIEDEIYFIPRCAKDIFCYNLLSKDFQALNALPDDFNYDKKIDAIVQGTFIYCVNRFPDTVIRIDSISKEIKVYYADVNPHIDRIIESEIYKIYQTPCLYQGRIIWSNYNNMITIFDIEKECFIAKMLDGLSHERIRHLSGALDDIVEDWIVRVKALSGILWLFSFHGRVYQYCNNQLKQVENELFSSYVNYQDMDGISAYIFIDMVLLGDGLVFIPSYKNKCIKFSNNTKQYEEVFKSYTQNWNGYRRSYTLCKVIGEQKILLYSYYESCFYILDIENNSIEKGQMEIPYAKFVKKFPQFEQMLRKDGIVGFDDLDYICEKLFIADSGDREKSKSSANDIGKRIFETMKQL